MIAGQIEIQLLAGIARLQADMDRANRIVGESTSRMSRAAGLAKGALGAIAGVLSVAAFAGWIKGAIDAADAASKMSAKTGVAVKDIAGLQLAFDLGGAGGEMFSNSMVKLSKAITEGNKGLAAMKIQTTDSTGQLRSNKDVLYSVADAFQKMDDGARKTSMAVEVFGKTGADLIPLLNGGAEGLRQMDEMARKLGLTISEKTAKDAEAFNDNLDLLAMGSQGVARGVAAELLPTLTSLSASFLTSMTSGDKLKNTADFLGTGLKILYSIAIGIVEVFATVGRAMAGVATIMTTHLMGSIDVLSKMARGDFKEAWNSAKATVTSMGTAAVVVAGDIKDSWMDTGKAASDVWTGAGNAAFMAMAAQRKASEDLLAQQKKVEDATEAARKKAVQAAEAAEKARVSFIEALEKEVASMGLSSAQIKLNEAATLGLTGAKLDYVKALVASREAFQAEEKFAKQAALATAQIMDGLNATTVQLIAEARAQEESNDRMGVSKTVLADLDAQRMLNLATLKDENASLAETLDLSGAMSDEYRKQAKALRERAAATTAGAQKELDQQGLNNSVTKAKDLLEILTAVDAATKSAASSMAESFGRVGSAIGGLTTALSGYAVQQQAIAAQMAAAKADPKNGPEKIAKLEIAAAHASAQSKIKSYGDMAGAAKGFFKENSKGYKAMEAVERAYRAAEMAMAIQAMIKKIFFKEGEVAANLALNGTKLVGETATTAVSTGLAATEASAWGITAVVKALASLPFPANLAAGAATLAAVVAIGAKMLGGVGGGGGPSLSESRQAAAGTGSILGDSSAKSESIAKAIELSAQNSNIELTHTAGMLRSLRAIEGSIGGLGNLLVRNTSNFSGDIANDKLSGVKSAINKVFGGNRTEEDRGLMGQATSVGSIIAGGFNAQQYRDMKKDGGWFSSDKRYTESSSLGSEANGQFALVIANMVKGVSEAGELLGIGGDAFTSMLNSFVVDIGKVSFKGLTGEQIQAQLQTVFSKVADDMARWSVAGVAQFQKVGEGAFETLTRIASNYANLDSILDAVSMKFGAVGLSSIAARESLIDLAGGIDELAGMTSSFAENYLTEAERLAPVAKYVAEEMGALGLAGVTTREQFKSVVLGLELSTAAGREQYVAMMALESSFAKVRAATVDLTKSQQAIADERADLQKQLDQLTLTSAQLLDKQRMALDASNRGLFDQVQMAMRAHEAQSAAKASLGDLIGNMRNFGNSARSLRDSLTLGNLSNLTPEQQYAEARKQLQRTEAAALAGDVAAQSNFAAVQTAFLAISQKVNGGDSLYDADFKKAIQTADAISAWTDGQIDVAQASLTALNDQVAWLAKLNESVRAVEQATMADQPKPEILVGNPDYRNIGTPDMAPLVEEIKMLRVEVAGLREEQKQQTGDLIQSNDEAADRSAGRISNGFVEAATSGAWSANNPTRVNLL